MNNEDLIEIRDKVREKKEQRSLKKEELIGEMEYKKLDYMYDIEVKLEEIASIGEKLEIRIRVGDIDTELNRLVRKYKYLRTITQKEVRVKSRLRDFSRLEEKKLVRYLDMKVGIGVNEAYNNYLESLNREQEYYINQASGHYGIIIRVQEYKYKEKKG